MVNSKWAEVYDAAPHHATPTRVHFHTNIFNSQEICRCTDFDDAVEELELLRPRLNILKGELPCLFGDGSELQVLVQRCNTYHLIEDIFLLGMELDELDSIDNRTEPGVVGLSNGTATALETSQVFPKAGGPSVQVNLGCQVILTSSRIIAL